MKMRETKPSAEVKQRVEKERKRRQRLVQLKNKFKNKTREKLSQEEINELVLMLAELHGLIE